MENTYGVDVQNRFDLCIDDDIEDPAEILKKQEAEILRRKNEKSADKPKQVKQPTTSSQKSKKEVISTVTSKADEKEKNATAKPQGRSTKPSNRPTGKVVNEEQNRRNMDSTPFLESHWDVEPRRGRGGLRGSRGVSRGKIGGFDQRGKREFDRQSGSNKSGVKPVEKREGGGAHNWGTVTDEMQCPDNPDNEERSGDEALTSGEPKETSTVMPEKMKEPEELTLDEWKKQEKMKRCVPSYNLRKPGEGDEKKWQKCYMLKKKEHDEDDDEYEDEEIMRRGRQKQHLDIEIKFADLMTRGRGRGRGGFNRGGRGGRIANPETSSQPASADALQLAAPKVDDFTDFPSLSNT